MQISLFTALGALSVLILIAVVGIVAGRKVKSASDFTTGHGMKIPMVAGSLVGTLVGGASTIGTAQLAFTYGMSAWWYTLGGGLGLFVMALFFAKPLNSSHLKTLPQILTKEYGKTIATTAAVLMSLGTFISIVSQMLSGAALITSVSAIPNGAAVAVTVLLMIIYVFFGGAWGAGMVGMVKTVLLYVVTLVCGGVVLYLAGGFSVFARTLPAEQYFDLFARGAVKDGGAGLSLIFGVLTTQAYFLPVVSAKDVKTARRGSLLGGVLTAVIGIAGILVGLYMRIAMPQTPSASVLPVFVCTYLPDVLAGVILATLLVALVGTGAGLALGISSMLTIDIYQPMLRPKSSDRERLWFSRSTIVVLFAAAAVFACGEAGSMILNWSFLSMGLRGTVAFMPVCFALFAPGKASSKTALLCVILSPLVVLVSSFMLPENIDPLFPGMIVSVVIFAVGAIIKKCQS